MIAWAYLRALAGVCLLSSRPHRALRAGPGPLRIPREAMAWDDPATLRRGLRATRLVLSRLPSTPERRALWAGLSRFYELDAVRLPHGPAMVTAEADGDLERWLERWQERLLLALEEGNATRLRALVATAEAIQAHYGLRGELDDAVRELLDELAAFASSYADELDELAHADRARTRLAARRRVPLRPVPPTCRRRPSAGPSPHAPPSTPPGVLSAGCRYDRLRGTARSRP